MCSRFVRWSIQRGTFAGPFLLALVLGVFSAHRAAADEVLDAHGFNPNRTFVTPLPYEHIDPLTGNLLLTQTDLVLPGNAGFDLVIQRSYNSKIYSNYQMGDSGLAEDSWAGVGWTLHMGRVLNALSATPGPIE